MVGNKHLKYALAIAALFATTAAAPAMAASSVAVVGTGDLSPQRTSAQLTLSVQCDGAANAGETKSGTLTVHIFQPSGRLLNIGLGSAPVTCDGNQADIVVDVDAVPGLRFKPGPATAILKLTEQTNDSTNAVIGMPTTLESGTAVHLRP
jgi:hypothetical protein